MDIKELLEQSKDAVTVRRVFGEPIRHGDVLVVPVARVAQGGGAGHGQGRDGKGEEIGSGGGGGFGYSATPAGVFVIKDGEVRWRPAVDVNRIVLGGQLVGLALVLTIRTIFKKWHRRR
ncbi:spore germination protein GerW family protein [Nonomuraea sp. NPDC052265]|uniref:spore germination protein GerW family protein n=1 Tax=Nonomuraea sp. NPDC052265 TaxID=3364374 RepID=UPI0037C8A401